MTQGSPLPEGSTEAPEMLERQPGKSSGPIERLIHVGSTVAAIVVAALIINELEYPDATRQKADQLNQDTKIFVQTLDTHRVKLRDIESAQAGGELLVATAMIRGVPRNTVDALFYGSRDIPGLSNYFTSYNNELDDIDQAFQDNADTFPNLGNVTNVSNELRVLAKRNLDCISNAVETYVPAHTPHIGATHCALGNQHYYVLQDQIVRVQNCESKFSLYLHSTSRLLQLEARADLEKAKKTGWLTHIIQSMRTEPEGRISSGDASVQERASLNPTCTSELDAPIKSTGNTSTARVSAFRSPAQSKVAPLPRPAVTSVTSPPADGTNSHASSSDGEAARFIVLPGGLRVDVSSCKLGALGLVTPEYDRCIQDRENEAMGHSQVVPWMPPHKGEPERPYQVNGPDGPLWVDKEGIIHSGAMPHTVTN